MDMIRLGRTNLQVSRSGFGALPIQRISYNDTKHILLKAFNNGINFIDTARDYTDSEEKIGYSLSEVRKDIIIATKTDAMDKETLLKQLEISLKNLKTDYIDIYQLHNQETLPNPEDPDGIYSALLSAKKRGLIRFIGISNHKLSVAKEAVLSGLYDTVQFPLCSLSSEEDLGLIEVCRTNDVGVIAMKALSGGLITNTASAFAFLRQYENLVPIWGIQRESELDQFLSFEKNPPVLDDAMWKVIYQDRSELSGAFCRGCEYCMPCPVGIPISMAARMSLILRRAPYEPLITSEWKEKMNLINQCKDCGQCRNQCPYKLNTPEILKHMLKDYEEFYSRHHSE